MAITAHRPPRPRQSTTDQSTIVDWMRNLREDYNLHNDSRFRRDRPGVSGSGRSADWHVRDQHRWLKGLELARDFDRNDVVLGQAVDRVVANCLQDGMTLDPDTGDDALDEALKKRWNEECEEPDLIDSQGEACFAEIERNVCRAEIVDGDVIPLLRSDGTVQVIEAHRCRTPHRTTQNVVLGVLMDGNRRRLSYWIAPDDIDPLSGTLKVGDVKQVPVKDAAQYRQVCHLYDRRRVSQTRGITAFAPVVDVAGMQDDLQFAKLVQAQIVSCFAIIEELSESAPTPGTDAAASLTGNVSTEQVTDTFAKILEGMSPGVHLRGRPGSTLKGFSPNVPNAEFFDHTMLLLTFLAINLDCPLAVLLLDPSKTNFSGWRGAIDQARICWRRRQNRLIERFHRPFWINRVRGWLANDPDLQDAFRRGVNIFGHVWRPPEWRYIQPEVDGAADLLLVRNGLSSYRRQLGRRGIDWDELYPEIVNDNADAIAYAIDKANEINKRFGSDVVHWRELLSLPTPDGIQSVLNAATLANQGQANSTQHS